MENCPKCGATQRSTVADCPACGNHLGFPNVRIASTPEELDALERRYSKAKASAEAEGLSNEFQNLLTSVETHGNVVVSLPVDVALNLVSSDTSQYVNYEKLVGSGARTPSAFANDAQRKVVAGSLFGSFGDEICYGVLTLSERGLATYGDIYCVLKKVTIDARASFLEINSYDFVRQYGELNQPLGYRANWLNRAKLVAIKLVNRQDIRKGESLAEWERRILVCDGERRDRDEFVEAHIYGSFNLYSIEKMVAAQPIKKGKQSLVEAVLDAFSSSTQVR